jgi:hypothetical protein
MVIYHIDMVILETDMGDEANDMGDERIDTVISHIDMGYLVTLALSYRALSVGELWTAGPGVGIGQGLTLVHFSAQRKRFLWDRGCI